MPGRTRTAERYARALAAAVAAVACLLLAANAVPADTAPRSSPSAPVPEPDGAQPARDAASAVG
ncbi:hypothetical protein EV562_109258 [Streptomyces sp. BK208]|uniref:hypothetical protein n=1 Tax=Streptomyces sp. BK208 TaxID=2512150 RepID=UPI00106145A5|nr:hypothetical protein [Streptomyces sp. BK208]TDT35317.1 hypothetical protein EV562_109258 [Streptomyces sp. BK208]